MAGWLGVGTVVVDGIPAQYKLRTEDTCHVLGGMSARLRSLAWYYKAWQAMG